MTTKSQNWLETQASVYSTHTKKILTKAIITYIRAGTEIFWSDTFWLDFQFMFLEKTLAWLRKLSSSKKLAISNVESFLKSNIDTVLIQSIKFRSLTPLSCCCFIFLLKIGEELSSY